jgi:hypothetical protein
MAGSTFEALTAGDVLTVDFGRHGRQTLTVKSLDLKRRAIITDRGVYSAKNLIPAILAITCKPTIPSVHGSA